MTRITELKSENIHQIRSCFYEGTIWTKNKLAKQTGLSLAATTNILQILVNAREIKQIGEAKSTGGRKSKQYLVNKDYCHFGQIILKRDDVNHYFIIKSYDLLKQKLTDRQVISKQGTILELLDIIKELIKIDNKIKLLTLSVPGVCQNGKINICDFDQFVNIDLKKLIKEKYDLDVVMGNDVNVASIGFAKRYPKVNNIVLMYQPKVKYIGCGIIINQQLLTGYSNFAGELSYLPFISFDEQDQLLKKNPNDLLMKQLVTICCVINPEIIGICSDVLANFDDTKLPDYLAIVHQPRIINVANFDQLISEGLFNLGLTLLKNKKRKREI